jgi:hypothetical protein
MPGGMIRGQGPGGVKPKQEMNSTMVVESSSLRLDGQGYPTTSGSGGTMQMNQVQSIQGAITLPGGTITVTPLAPIIGVPITTTYGNNTGDGGSVNGASVMTLKQTGSNGLPISVISPHETGQQSSGQQKQNPNKLAHPRRNLINQVPPSVGHLVQNLQKTLVEAVKSSMEQIVVEMVENSPNASNSTEIKSLKEEVEKLRKQLLDTKHNSGEFKWSSRCMYIVYLLCLIQSKMIRKGILNDFVFLSDVAIREVKLTMENDKKRALNELRRQSEHDKLKAIEEIKKKQWCARCGREAQFYW